MIRRASERLTVGQLKLEQLLRAFEVGNIRQHRPIKGLNPRTSSAFTQTLDRRHLTC